MKDKSVPSRVDLSKHAALEQAQEFWVFQSQAAQELDIAGSVGAQSL
jgi:hypothetical protein